MTAQIELSHGFRDMYQDCRTAQRLQIHIGFARTLWLFTSLIASDYVHATTDQYIDILNFKPSFTFPNSSVTFSSILLLSNIYPNYLRYLGISPSLDNE